MSTSHKHAHTNQNGNAVADVSEKGFLSFRDMLASTLRPLPRCKQEKIADESTLGACQGEMRRQDVEDETEGEAVGVMRMTTRG